MSTISSRAGWSARELSQLAIGCHPLLILVLLSLTSGATENVRDDARVEVWDQGPEDIDDVSRLAAAQEVRQFMENDACLVKWRGLGVVEDVVLARPRDRQAA
jgi:hypothetical protein